MISGSARVLWLIEHVDRELDLACLIRSKIEEKPGVTIDLRHVYLAADRFLREPPPSLVVLPFFYRTTDAVVREMVRKWPKTTFLTLSFEQIFSKASVKTKVPVDDFTRKNVLHLAWGKFYAEHLVRHGVASANVAVLGNPVYALYRDPYRAYYPDRATLGVRYGLDPAKPWLWIPEDHRYAFFGDDRIEQLASMGGDREELRKLRDFSRSALVDILRWSSEAAREFGMEVILRPRPAVHTDQLRAFYETHVGPLAPPVHIVKGESAREWILTADWMLSAFSTTLIEGATLGKAAFSVEPVPTPDSYFAAWHPHAPRIRSRDELFAVARAFREAASRSAPLADWAAREMGAARDPVESLVVWIRGAATGEIRPVGGATPPPLPRPSLKEWINSFRPRNRHFSAVFHEKDRFDDATVADRVTRWRRALERA